MQQEAGGLHHFAIHAPGRKRGGVGGRGVARAAGRGRLRWEGETGLPAGSQPPPSSPRCCHLCTPQGVWGFRPEVSGGSPPHPTDEVSEDPGRGCGWPSPAPGPPGPRLQGTRALPGRCPSPCGSRKGVWLPSPAPGPPGDPELSSVSDRKGNGPDLRTKGTL